MERINIESIVLSAFSEHFKGQPVVVRAPGRINLIGEHTDYNDGFALPATIDRSIVAALAENHTASWCRAFSVDTDRFLEFDSQFDVQYAIGSWENYIVGVVRELILAGHEIGGFDVAFGGDIPIGAGLSSSAALENGLVFGLNELFDLDLEDSDMIAISQKAEHNFAGVHCGILDQFATMKGRQNQVLFLDCRTLQAVYLPLQLEEYELLLINSNVKHRLADSEYNTRREECQTGLEILRESYPDIKALRDVSLQKLEAVRDSLPSLIYDRCLYIVRENMRVVHAVLALEQGDFIRFGKILFNAHMDMRDLYAISCEPIDYLVELAKLSPVVIGARMMGGGFGGCTINLVKKGKTSDFYNETLQGKYCDRFGVALDAYVIKIADGVHRIDNGNDMDLYH